MPKLTLGLVVAFFSLSGPAFAGAVYQNTTTDTGDTLSYATNGFTQIGDQIALQGTDRYATLAVAQFFNEGSAGTASFILRLFNVGAPVGAQIGADYAVDNFSVPAVTDPPAGIFNVSFILPKVLVPDNLIFTLAVSNQSAGVDIVGVNMFEPPTVGSSDNTFAIANNGSSFLSVATSSENVFLELDATSPEPSTIVLALNGIAIVGFRCLARRPRSPPRKRP